MLRASLLCSSTSVTFTPIQLFNPNNSHRFPSFELARPVSALSRTKCHCSFVRARGKSSFLVRSTATQEAVETSSSNSGVDLVEVGFLSGVHGLQGEICIKPNTDFPDLRFSKPGRRWLRQQLMGQDKIDEVELVEGRPHPAQKSWILKFRGLDDVDQVRQLVGATLLAEEDDRPELDEGEFYTRDLVGLRVLLKETGQLVGTVANVFDNGGNDLLHVLLDSSMEVCNGGAKTNQLVWIPFVDAIVPDVDLERKEMYITPPKGLLEVNMRADDRSKKERRQLEWKERKKQQKRLIAAKKKLLELEQKHVFDGLRYGEKSQRNLLADHILDVNATLLQKALQSVETSSKRWNVTEEINALRARVSECNLNVSRECLSFDASKEKVGDNFSFLQQGQSLFSEGKVSICLVLNDDENEQPEGENGLVSYLHTLLDEEQRFIKEEDRACVPLVIVSPEHTIEALQNLFQDNDHFGFESEKIWFLKEETLPVVCSSPEEPKKHKILMKSPWEILKSPVGSGGVLSILASHGITDSLSNLGIDYLQIHSIETKPQPSQHYINPMLVGFVNAKGAEIGIQVTGESDIKNFEMTFSTKFLKRLKGKIEFEAVMKVNSHVQKVEKEWVESVPSERNSFEFHSDIYRVLSECSSPAKICLMNIAV
ncbi:UDP-N-acetylglucosamine diphosphorylase 1 [Cardamine amara subsp. amara]|uniref:UDP-N-acetylglucosamine diphosphorylase 1 n=1 Tax=Cardamine amara subsp. amara TaxID=228776 RepID=A0ABD1BTL6_CARAN